MFDASPLFGVSKILNEMIHYAMFLVNILTELFHRNKTHILNTSFHSGPKHLLISLVWFLDNGFVFNKNVSPSCLVSNTNSSCFEQVPHDKFSFHQTRQLSCLQQEIHDTNRAYTWKNSNVPTVKNMYKYMLKLELVLEWQVEK